LSKLLPDATAEELLDSNQLLNILKGFAKVRQPRTAALVRGARAQGEDRVVDAGLEASEARDERLRRKWQNEATVAAGQDALLREPF
jgi:salicylate hydroxylase